MQQLHAMNSLTFFFGFYYFFPSFVFFLSKRKKILKKCTHWTFYCINTENFTQMSNSTKKNNSFKWKLPWKIKKLDYIFSNFGVLWLMKDWNETKLSQILFWKFWTEQIDQTFCVVGWVLCQIEFKVMFIAYSKIWKTNYYFIAKFETKKVL